MESQDPEERIAELERQLADARAAAQRSEIFDEDDSYLNTAARESYSSRASGLAAAPRRVPLRFLLAEALPFRWWYLFTMFIVAIPPIIVWMWKPMLFLPAAVLVLVSIYGFHLSGVRTRITLLKWGQVASVTGAEVLSQATYYGGTTYSNVVLPVARGWTVTRPLWSGPKTKTRIRYRLDAFQGDITVGGREYLDGVVLADQRKPERALCVTSFPYDLDRDDSGNWIGHLRGRLQIGMACWLLVMIGWVGGAAMLYGNYESYAAALPSGPGFSTRPTLTSPTPSPTMTAAPGEALIINGTNETWSISCAENDVIVNGSTNRVDITGHCLSLTVSGRANVIGVDVADSITASGLNNVVTFRAGSPHIDTSGIGNVVKPG